jgi:molybdate transport system ATP-binding protein
MTLSVKIRHRQGDFSLDVTFAAEGGVTALFGASGSGKTSILRILGGLTRPDDGKIALDGDMLLDTERRLFVPAHRRRSGYVFQEPRLFPHLSVHQNLTYGRWFARRAGPSADLDRILEMLGISHLLERRPATLSGGEKQRVSIGRALLSSPRLLLMDEPLSALDEARKAEILPYLERLRDELDLPILYVSHSVSEVARLADRVVVLADGRVQAVGSASDMLGNLSDAGGREAGSVLTGTVSVLDAETGLATIAFKGMSLVVPPAHLSVGQRVRVHVPARDVLVATEKPAGISALNIVPGQISTLTRMVGGTVDLAIVCGDEALHARITEVSVGRLQLAVGRPVHAIIKTVALERS